MGLGHVLVMGLVVMLMKGAGRMRVVRKNWIGRFELTDMLHVRE